MRYSVLCYTEAAPTAITRLGFLTAYAALKNVILRKARGSSIKILDGKKIISEDHLINIVNPSKTEKE